MTRRPSTAFAAAIAVLGASLVPATLASATATTSYVVSATVPASLSATMPLLRLHFNVPAHATSLPALRTSPALNVRWQQIGARDVQAIAVGQLLPAVTYTISAPTRMSCARSCTFSTLRRHVATVATSLTWEAQLLAELNYLPVRFTPNSPQSDPTQSVSGTFAWKYAGLPTSLSAQWRLGTDNIVLHGAVMAFQSVNGLATTGVADSPTWAHLLSAVQSGAANPGSYNYVVVSEANPQTTTLYVAGHKKLTTPANTGISVSPTVTGTFPVYLRYVTQTMSGTNPDGSHYSDPGIPWVSYFNGGDALHGFIRSTYGWPQSLGCIEMPFAAAKVIYPYTPIGTLVTVTS
jgi:peptidoglycan hydrolase-like protein with peptidoglycan-binding domain